MRLFHRKQLESSNIDSHQPYLIGQQTLFKLNLYQRQKSMRKEPQGYCSWFYVKNTDIPGINDKANHKTARLDQKKKKRKRSHLKLRLILICLECTMDSEFLTKVAKIQNLFINENPFTFPWRSLVVFGVLEKAKNFSARMVSSLILSRPKAWMLCKLILIA